MKEKCLSIKSVLTVRIDEELHNKLRNIALNTPGLSLNNLVNNLLKEQLNNQINANIWARSKLVSGRKIKPPPD